MTHSLQFNGWSLALFTAMAALAMILPDMALAGGGFGGGGGGGNTGEPIARVLCTVVGWFTGPVGKGIATLAVIVIGIGALMGKVSWGMAIIVGIGVAVIFGANTIVAQLGDGAGFEDACIT